MGTKLELDWNWITHKGKKTEGGTILELWERWFFFYLRFFVLNWWTENNRLYSRSNSKVINVKKNKKKNLTFQLISQ